MANKDLGAEGQQKHRKDYLQLFLQVYSRAARITTNSPYDASAVPLLQNFVWPSIKYLMMMINHFSSDQCHYRP